MLLPIRPIYQLSDAKLSKVEGGSYVHVNVRWSQKLTYQDHEFCLRIPFTFPAYVVPVVKGTSNKEKVSLNVISGMETEVMCNRSSHPLMVCCLYSSLVFYIQ